MIEPKSTISQDLECIMTGLCPKCTSDVKEECTNQETDEWTITCPICDFIMVFEGV